MDIWAHTKSPPQQIGRTDGAESLAELLAGARKARHPMRHAVRLQAGKVVTIHMFDDLDRLEAYLSRHDGILEATDRADWPELEAEPVTLADGPALQTLIPGVPPADATARALAQLQAARFARRGRAPLPAGGLFDDVARRQQELFS